MNRTPSTVILTTLDLSKTQAQADAYVKADKGEQYHAGLGFPLAAIDTPGGLYVLCNEGVGVKVTDDEPYTLDIYAEQEGFIAMFPVAQGALKPAAIREAMTGEPVALHDFIRAFGARLEDNYNLWDRTLSQAMTPATPALRG